MIRSQSVLLKIDTTFTSNVIIASKTIISMKLKSELPQWHVAQKKNADLSGLRSGNIDHINDTVNKMDYTVTGSGATKWQQ